jgi:Domain of unknown function (DUF3854)/AAA domain
MTVQTQDFRAKFREECIKGSAIAPELFDATIEFIEDNGQWEPNRALGQHVAVQWQTNKPHNFGVLACFMDELGDVWQGKPENPRGSEDGKILKYEKPLKSGSTVYLPVIPDSIRMKISERHGRPVPMGDDVFWLWAMDTDLPIVITEGAKKALSLLSQGHIALALVGVNGGYSVSEASENGPVSLDRPKLIGTVESFLCSPDRRVTLAFDQDEKAQTKAKVRSALVKFGKLLTEAKADVYVASWDGNRGKGIDDIAAKVGPQMVEATIGKASRFEEWEILTRRPEENQELGEFDLVKQADLLKLGINRWLRTPDGAQQALLKTQLCRRYGISGPEFDRLAREIRFAEKQNSRKPRLLSMKELLSMESQGLEFLIDGWLPVRDSALLSGLTGASKTLFTIHMALSIATGDKFLGEQCKQGKVLILNSDQPLSVTRSYLTNIGFNEYDENIKIVGECPEMASWTVKDMEALEGWLEEFKPDIVIADSIRTIICYPLGIAEKDEMVGHWISEVNKLVNRYGSIVWVHHDVKNGEASGIGKSSGSTAIVSNNSFHWGIENPAKGNASHPIRKLEAYKTRRVEPLKVELKYDPETCTFNYLGRVGESPEIALQQQTLQMQVLNLFNQPGAPQWMEGAEIRSRLSNDGIFTTLARMAGKGLLSTRPIPTKSEPGKRGRRGTLYALPGTDCASYTIEDPTPPSYIQSVNVSEVLVNSETPSTQGSRITNTITNTLLTITNTHCVSKGDSEGVSISSPYPEGDPELLTANTYMAGESRTAQAEQVKTDTQKTSACVTVEPPPKKDAKPLTNRYRAPMTEQTSQGISVGEHCKWPQAPLMLAYMAERGGLVRSIGGGFATLEGNDAKIPISQLVKTGITPPEKKVEAPPEFVDSYGGRFTIGCRVRVTFEHLLEYDRKQELKEMSRPLGACGTVLEFGKTTYSKGQYNQALLKMDDGSDLRLPLGYLDVVIDEETDADF